MYNRSNNKEELFRSDKDRIFFLSQYAKYLHPMAETLCWSLLPNHFHFLIRIREANEITATLQRNTSRLKDAEKRFLACTCTLNELIEQEWRYFFTVYSMVYNKQYGRKGNLLHRPFKRLEINKDTHLTQAIVYIHANAVHHSLVNDLKTYKWSSWHSILSSKSTMLNREYVINLFGGRQEFIDVHLAMSKVYSEQTFIPDE